MMSMAIRCQSEDAKSVLRVQLLSRLALERRRTVSEKHSKWDHFRYGIVLGCHVIVFLAKRTDHHNPQPSDCRGASWF
jgi:hypothetical protein